MKIRRYHAQRDRKTVRRIWREVGWIAEQEEEKERMMDVLIASGRAMVAELNSEAECVVLSVPGVIRYLNEDLEFSDIVAVATSHIARKQGIARRLTAQLIAADAIAGTMVTGLTMLEQGFYNQLGFGTAGYEHWISFDPMRLDLDQQARVPRRLTKDDWEMVHTALLARRRGHGACNLNSVARIQENLGWTRNNFGLGYNDGPEGELTHFIWFRTNGDYGSYTVTTMAYQNRQQFLELMALLKSLSDQVCHVRMREPASIQLQDLILQPFRHRFLTERSQYENRIEAKAHWQLRICDLPGCLAQTHLSGKTLRFNLQLSDPIIEYLDADSPWCGVAGEYVITLGASSAAEEGMDATLPVLEASVGAFTRMWLGVRPATGLMITDDLVGPPELLAVLDRVLRLPEPKVDWDF